MEILLSRASLLHVAKSGEGRGGEGIGGGMWPGTKELEPRTKFCLSVSVVHMVGDGELRGRQSALREARVSVLQSGKL